MDRKSILLADDESDIREVVTKYLNREGFSVEQAVDGAEALALFYRKNWDLVILDIRIPNTDGIKVCQEIRKISQVPVVMLTDLNNETNRIQGLEIGADDCVGKPFSPRELVARIKAILRRSTAARSAKKNRNSLSGG
ncbi:response regulator transcription factor [Desulforamulus putei]|uniref:Stage 0 sporulation protein A homolog n=1 Tax=Desulforamulus putei DSM 12395 TaxID=1121429 RepID=A0A1M4U3H3_9FIRM|nr:response regulator transcription factor [Desulforamulus putei]SHE51087.1 Response regulator receiver domain-containing protein [Desulforamulus putei DSM 12395]